MSIQNQLDERLWAAILKSYEDRHFSTTISDAIQFLGDLIREKTGLESDGANLVGDAFGGKNPRLRVNRLQTETEQNVQSGVEQLLRGVYRAIRNPRHHSKHEDSQADADAIVLFLNYLLKIIDQSKSKFDRSNFIARVFDSDFVEDKRYAQVLIEEIPERYRFEVLIEIFRGRDAGKPGCLALVLNALNSTLSDVEKAEFAEAVSDELNILSSADTYHMVRILPKAIWPLCRESARLRTENKIIESIKEGRENSAGKCTAGVLGTWLSNITPNFLMHSQLQKIVANKLRSKDKMESDYAFNFIFTPMRSIPGEISYAIRFAIKAGLTKGDRRFHSALNFLDNTFELDPDDAWTKQFKSLYDLFEEKDIEFDESAPDFDEDIPF